MGTFVHWQCSVPLGVMNCECPIHTNNCWQGSCSSSCAPEPVPSPPQFKLPQPVKNTQNSLPWIATSVWEVSVPTEPMLCVRLCAWYIACFPVSKHKGTQEIEIFTSICQWTDLGVRAKIQTVQGHMPLGVGLVCGQGFAWWLLHTGRCSDLSGFTNWII